MARAISPGGSRLLAALLLTGVSGCNLPIGLQPAHCRFSQIVVRAHDPTNPATDSVTLGPNDALELALFASQDLGQYLSPQLSSSVLLTPEANYNYSTGESCPALYPARPPHDTAIYGMWRPIARGTLVIKARFQRIDGTIDPNSEYDLTVINK